MLSGEEQNSQSQQAVRTRIVQAAEKLFGQKGFSATSISDIVEEANVGRSLIYYYFKDKKSLYDAILAESGERIVRIAQKARDLEGNAFDRLKCFISSFCAMHDEHPHVPKMLMRADIEGTMRFEDHAEKYFRSVDTILEAILEEGLEKGELRYVKPNKTAHVVLAISHSIHMAQMQSRDHFDAEKDIDFALEILKHGISS